MRETMLSKEKKLHPSVQFHEDIANQWEKKYHKHTFNKRLGSLLSLLDGIDLPSSKILDAGCGTGTITKKVVDYAHKHDVTVERQEDQKNFEVIMYCYRKIIRSGVLTNHSTGKAG